MRQPSVSFEQVDANAAKPAARHEGKSLQKTWVELTTHSKALAPDLAALCVQTDVSKRGTATPRFPPQSEIPFAGAGGLNRLFAQIWKQCSQSTRIGAQNH